MKTILMVDDDDALRRLVRIELGTDFRVIDSGEPEQGLALALEHKPDAILLDLRMPKYSGYELLQTFTSFSRTQMIPVIVVSGEGGGQTREHCKELGATSYFEKPIDFDGLRKCLQNVAESRPYVPRTEVRVRLRVALVLQGTNCEGRQFEEGAATENVSLNGFLCSCTAAIPVGSVVGVFISGSGKEREYVGSARIVHSGTKSAALRQYGCCFIKKTGPWVLQ